jgi:hypothetical protein
MPNLFPIVQVSPDAPEEEEAMGTKEKFWFHDRDRGLCLYKKARPGTGEDWSEKIAAELCQLLGLPHADYDLATLDGCPGTISPSFLPEAGSLTPGNEVMAQLMPDYPSEANNPSQHTINNVFQVIGQASVNLPLGWTPLDGIRNAADVFIGYLMLDAWIGNSDRPLETKAFYLKLQLTHY